MDDGTVVMEEEQLEENPEAGRDEGGGAQRVGMRCEELLELTRGMAGPHQRADASLLRRQDNPFCIDRIGMRRQQGPSGPTQRAPPLASQWNPKSVRE